MLFICYNIIAFCTASCMDKFEVCSFNHCKAIRSQLTDLLRRYRHTIRWIHYLSQFTFFTWRRQLRTPYFSRRSAKLFGGLTAFLFNGMTKQRRLSWSAIAVQFCETTKQPQLICSMLNGVCMSQIEGWTLDMCMCTKERKKERKEFTLTVFLTLWLGIISNIIFIKNDFRCEEFNFAVSLF